MKRFLITSLSLILFVSAASVAAGSRQVSSTGPITDFSFSENATDRAVCNLKSHNDTVTGFWSAYADGIRTVAFYDPATCGSPTYPFQINSLGFTLYDPGGYQWPVTVDVVVFDAVASGDSCLGPQAELCRFTIICDSTSFALPNVGLAEFPTPCCVSGPFFIGIEYNDGGAGPYPSVVFDSDGPEACNDWMYFTDGLWHDWPGFWTPPLPGDPVFWVQGTTESSDCGTRVALNELLVAPDSGAGSGFAEHGHQWVEIFNAGSDSVDLSGWTVSNNTGLAVISLPSWILPPGSFLTLHQFAGTDDSDFSDLDGHFYTGDTTTIFDRNQDECGLYAGFPDPSTIVDFVNWDGTGSYVPGVSESYATSAGIWTAGSFFDSQSMKLAECLSRYFDGFDRDLPGDWRLIDWILYAHNQPLQPENPIQESPPNLVAIANSMPAFEWSYFPDADSFQIQVDDNISFTSPEININGLTTNSYTPTSPLDDNAYFFRIRAFVGGYATRWAAAWLTLIETTAPTPPNGSRNCPHKWQHKDSNLLCIWDARHNKRPGCPETGNCGWDKPHPNSNPPTNGCAHGRMYCVPTSIAMMNAKYGGDLHIDRIVYEIKKVTRAAPEGDIGHNRGYRPPPSNEETGGLSWALNNAAIAVHANPTFNQIKGWVDNLGCFMARIPGHMVVIDGYFDYQTPAGSDAQIVYTEDPWNGPGYRYIYKYVIAGTPQPHWARRYSTTRFAHVFIQPAAGVTARMEEATVTTDTDGDGIMDFDEGLPGYPADRPRTLQAKFNEVDSDSDQVSDYMEIKNYTFHDQPGHDPGHENDALTFPDIDGDNLRAEHDCDSDNDADFDGGEDINGDSFNPIPAGGGCTTETCQFKAAEKCIKISVDKDVYLLGEPVYIVDWHGSRETHTYHESSTYNYELGGPPCITKSDGDAIAWNGSFTTDTGGHALKKRVMYCYFPGTYYLYADVLSDHKYSEPDNWDPSTCWECNIDWYHGWHYYYDYPYHNPTYPWPAYDYPMICITEDIAIQTTYNTIEVPWWWWCYSWPPVTTDYWLGVQVPEDLIFSGQLQMSLPPEFVQETPDCNGSPINQFIPTEIVALDLTATYPPDSGHMWLGFEIQNWQIPDSFMVTRLRLDVINTGGNKLANEPMVKIIAGNSAFGWSPTMYDSIPLVGLPGGSCCDNPGDANNDGSIDIADLTFIVAYMFSGGMAPPCLDESDLNADCSIDIADLTYRVAYMFQGGPAPVCGCMVK